MTIIEKLYISVLEERKQKKNLTGYDYYKMIRKPTPPPGASFKDKSKYTRKQKHKKNNID